MENLKDKIKKTELQLERDVQRVQEMSLELTEIIKRVHLIGMEQGAAYAFLNDKEKEEK